MIINQAAEGWEQFWDRMRAAAGKRRHEDPDVIAGNRDMLPGSFQDLYGMTREQARKAVDDPDRGNRN